MAGALTIALLAWQVICHEAGQQSAYTEAVDFSDDVSAFLQVSSTNGGNVRFSPGRRMREAARRSIAEKAESLRTIMKVLAKRTWFAELEAERAQRAIDQEMGFYPVTPRSRNSSRQWEMATLSAAKNAALLWLAEFKKFSEPLAKALKERQAGYKGGNGKDMREHMDRVAASINDLSTLHRSSALQAKVQLQLLKFHVTEVLKLTSAKKKFRRRILYKLSELESLFTKALGAMPEKDEATANTSGLTVNTSGRPVLARVASERAHQMEGSQLLRDAEAYQELMNKKAESGRQRIKLLAKELVLLESELGE